MYPEFSNAGPFFSGFFFKGWKNAKYRGPELNATGPERVLNSTPPVEERVAGWLIFELTLDPAGQEAVTSSEVTRSWPPADVTQCSSWTNLTAVNS
jgi:hypothetical protein